MDKFDELLSEIPEFMEEEDRQDPEFRATVLTDQIGALNRHISHDPELNPSTRPLQEPEEVAYGDALWQLLCLAHLRDVDIEDAISIALDRMESREGYLQQSDVDLEGIVASGSGVVEGVVGESVVVRREITPGDTISVTDYDCILTEIGGMTSHAATIAREREVACVVGIRSLTDLVSDGDRVSVDLDSGSVSISEEETL